MITKNIFLKSNVFFKTSLKQKWNTLLVPKEIARINLSLYFCQSFKITLEIFQAPRFCFFIIIACVASVHSYIKVPIIQICSSSLGNFETQGTMYEYTLLIQSICFGVSSLESQYTKYWIP